MNVCKRIIFRNYGTDIEKNVDQVLAFNFSSARRYRLIYADIFNRIPYDLLEIRLNVLLNVFLRTETVNPLLSA